MGVVLVGEKEGRSELRVDRCKDGGVGFTEHGDELVIFTVNGLEEDEKFVG